MALFKDSTGREWPVSIDFAKLVDVKKRVGVCLIDLDDEDRQAKRAQADLKRLSRDLPLLVNVLFVLCADEAAARGMSDIDFGKSLDGDSLLDGMSAIGEELTVFFLPRSEKDRGRETMRRRYRVTDQRLTNKVRESLDKMDREPLTEADLEALEREAIGSESDSSASGSTSPASSA